MDKAVTAFQQTAGLVDANVAQELAPHVPPDVFRKGVGKPDALEQSDHGPQIILRAAVTHAESKLSVVLAHGPVSFLAGIHFSGDAVHNLVGAESVGEILFTADPVQHRKNDGVRPNQVSGLFHRLRQSTVLDGVQDQLGVPCFGSGVAEREVTGDAIEGNALPAISFGSGGVSEHTDVLPSKCFGEIAGIHGTQCAEADNIHSGNGLH